MSGPVCPDCSCFSIKAESDEEFTQGIGYCEICGFRGAFNTSRRALPPEAIQRCSEIHERKTAGRLFFLRIYIKEGVDKHMPMKEVMGMLKISSYTSAGNRVILQRDEMPPEDILEQIRALDGVEKVTVY